MIKKDKINPQGMVFDIQRYSIHDGPGIRTIVFLKGCPLRCKWCSNPESQEMKPQVFFVKSRCIRCGLCVKNSKNGEVTMGEEGIEIHRNSINSNDLGWVDVCPTKALSIKGKLMSVDEVVDIVMKDEVFYRQSNGGVTLSGGEPLTQRDFSLELLKHIHGKGLSTAIETTGAVPWDSLLAVAPYTNLFLYDFKHWNDEEHIKYTGISNAQIIDNLKKLAETGANILVRVPLIPGVNDTEESINKTMDILKGIGINKLALLPFHQYGSGKYDSVGISYEMKDKEPPKEDHVAKLQKMIADAGFKSDYN
ncbi:MAG: glycyl-radical enzyme activating protein [Acetivibrionales bacterium]|jgi:pyruvate formate lyase activating enzyme